jgi:hypothetical protein
LSRITPTIGSPNEPNNLRNRLATRHLGDLLDKGCLVRLPGGGRSTRYRIDWPAAGGPDTPL